MKGVQDYLILVRWSVIIVKIHTFAEVDQSLLRGQSVHEHLIDM